MVWHCNPTFIGSGIKKLALKAFETYDPNRGVLLSTHLMNGLQKLSRFAYQRQSTLNVPEQHRLDYNKYNKAKRQLEDDLGQSPSHEQVADHLGVPPKKLKQLIELVNKQELLESGEGPSFQLPKEDNDIVDLAFYDMTPNQKKIFKYRTGYEKSPIKNADAIQKELNLTQGQLSYELQKIKSLLESARKFR